MKSQEDELYQEASTSVSDYVDKVKPIQRERRKRKLNRLIFAILALIIIGAGTVYYLARPKPQPKPQATQNKQDEELPETIAPTENFVSQSLMLTFDYPNNWTVDDQTQNQIRIVSPKTKVVSSSGQKQDSTVVVLIRAKSVPLSEFANDDAVAAVASEKLTYTRPTGNQRQETYLSFLRFGGGVSGVDGVYITGDSGYQQGVFVPKADLVPVEPIVSISVYECGASTCDTPSSFDHAEWTSNKFLQAAADILRSLSIN